MKVAAILSMIIFLPLAAFSATIHVPGDQPTIQYGIYAANDGDTVLVAPGIYVETINFYGKAITVKSSAGPEQTVIDGHQNDIFPIVSFINEEDASSVLDGFCLTNGLALYGAGIVSHQSAPIIRNNIIEYGNCHVGGAIYCLDSYCLIKNNIIRDNYADHVAGVYAENGAPRIVGNTFLNNLSDYSGCVASKYSSMEVDGNFMAYNQSDRGGAIYCYGASNPIITNNIIYNNEADVGGGLYIRMYASPLIINNTIIGNTADTGGAIHCLSATITSVANSILWDNGTDPIWVGDDVLPSKITFRCCNVEGGQSAAHIEPNCTFNWASGNIDSDPLFVDMANGDCHLTFNSPCCGSGDNNAMAGSLDFEGDPRIAHGAIDMGADEFHPHLYYTGNATAPGNIELKFIGLPGDSINGLILGVNIFDPPLPCDYGLWYMNNPMQIMTGFGTIPTDGVRVIPGNIPASPPGPFTVYLQAAIDLWLSNLCVLKVE